MGDGRKKVHENGIFYLLILGFGFVRRRLWLRGKCVFEGEGLVSVLHCFWRNWEWMDGWTVITRDISGSMHVHEGKKIARR
jgi:hypothetical protein